MAVTLAGNTERYRGNGWFADNNVWNPGNYVNGRDFTQTIDIDEAAFPNSTLISWDWPHDGSRPLTWDNFPVRSYPELIRGQSPWLGGGSSTQEFPIRLGEIESLDITYSFAMTGDRNLHNVAFSFWISSDPAQGRGGITDEVMVWVHSGYFTPAGDTIAQFQDANGAGRIRHLAEHGNQENPSQTPWEYTVYQYSQDELSGTIDLDRILGDLEERRILNGDHYLMGLEVGAEIAAGRGTLAMDIRHTLTRTGETGEDTVDGGPGDDTTGGGGEDTVDSGPGDDTTGGGDEDTVDGGAGEDTTGGGAGEDTVDGGTGGAPGGSGGGAPVEEPPQGALQGTADADSLTGTAGSDSLAGGAGADNLFGGQSADLIYGNQDSDLVYGNQGTDTLFGGQGTDTAFGGQDADAVYGNLGADVIYGNFANDALYGGQGSDDLYGGQGDDVLWGNLDADRLQGNLGADIFVFRPGGGADVVADFDFAGGDRLAIAAGMTYRVESGGDGAVVDFGNGDMVTLQGVDVQAVAADWFVIG